MSLMLSRQQLIELITITYSSSSSQEIKQAEEILINYTFQVYPKSFTEFEDILVSLKNQLSPTCKMAIINLIKIAGFQMLDTLSLIERNDDDLASKHNRLLIGVEHIFDNREIDSKIKAPIGRLYSALLIYFTPQNFQRLVRKCIYYFNTKDYFLALDLTQAYLDSKPPLRYRFQYMEAKLQILINHLWDNISLALKSQQISILMDSVIDRFFNVINVFWSKMTFEKFQVLFDKVFRSNNFLALITAFKDNFHNRSWRCKMYYIFNTITFSLGRCHLYNKYPPIRDLLRQLAQRQFLRHFNKQHFQDFNQQTASLQFVISSIQYKLIEINLTPSNILSSIILPNYLLFEKQFEVNSQNIHEIINILDDASFNMQSQTPVILRHKLLIEACRASEVTFKSLKEIIYVFFTHHASNNIDSSFKCVSYLVPVQAVEAWIEVGNTLSASDQVEVFLLYTSLSVSLFMSDIEFMNKLDEFISSNQEKLLSSPSQKIIFYALLLYKNYMDDIFYEDSSLAFRQSIILYAIKSIQRSQIITIFALQILKQKLSQKPTYQEIMNETSLLTKQMATNFRQQLIPIISTILKNYGEQIQKQDVTLICQKSLLTWKNQAIKNENSGLYLDLLLQFLDVSSCRDYYWTLLEEMVRIAQQNRDLIQKNIEEVMHIFGKGLEKCGKLPDEFQDSIVNFDLSIQGVKMMQTMNSLIAYSTNPAFFNWLARILIKNNLSTEQILLIHSLIYYESNALSYETIIMIIERTFLERIYFRHQFDYRNGKLNLIFVALLRYKWQITNQILVNENWAPLIDQCRRALQKSSLIKGRQNQIGQKPFIQQIFDLIYLQQNVYRWQYDIQMFLSNQLDIFMKRLSDPYQFKYSNLSFVACTVNIIRAMEFIEKEKSDYDESDSDESLHPRTLVYRAYRVEQEALKHYAIPAHCREINYFQAYKKIVQNLKKDENSHKWMKLLLKAALKTEQWSVFENVMTVQKNTEGVYRKIHKVRREQ